jgi:NAD(P)-dependent dehydrogenase (short-subunit alcohol dehydrogenase family)
MINDEKTVLITGASTGIGRATALHLDNLGLKVFAGVRKEADSEALSQASSPRLTPVILDVTLEHTIADFVAEIGASTGGTLDALINNAGRSLNGPLELLPTADVRSLFEVNVLGLLSVTRACIPLLRKGRGRLVNISSGHGLLAIPDKSAYAASKFAVQAISDSLRLELRPFGIHVSSLVVGKVDTAVLDKILAERERLSEASDPEVMKLYTPLFEFFDREVRNLPGIPPEEVARVVARALKADKPKAQYLVGPGARKMRNLARLPRRLRDALMSKALYGRVPS